MTSFSTGPSDQIFVKFYGFCNNTSKSVGEM